MIGAPLRTYDLRLAVHLDPPGDALVAFLDDVRTLTERHDGVEALWITERRGRPRVHPPACDLGNHDADERSAGGRTR
jgi:hypothetical protein